MQNILIEKPYVFLPPYDSRVWPALLGPAIRPILRSKFGIRGLEFRGVDRLARSIEAGHGVLLAPNHCRPCDPLLIGEAARQASTAVYMLASAHLFMQSPLQTWILRRAGAFPIYREGMDKAALNAAVEILETSKRPLVLFPEGIITRTNDRLNPLMEGTAFIARLAAKRRAKAESRGRVLVHPVALRYFFRGEIESAVEPTLAELERRLSWRPQSRLPLVERIKKIGDALLGLKEMEYLGHQQEGPIAPRLAKLIDHLLVPLEKEWLKGAADPSTAARVKNLRMAILPDMVKGEVSEEERERRWRQLADTYLAQQLACYPPDYVGSDGSPERILETVERFEEDLTDACRSYPPMEAVVEIGEAIFVEADRPREGEDPLMTELEARLKSSLEAAKASA
jgi:hypothetical protein